MGINVSIADIIPGGWSVHMQTYFTDISSYNFN